MVRDSRTHAYTYEYKDTYFFSDIYTSCFIYSTLLTKNPHFRHPFSSTDRS